MFWVIKRTVSLRWFFWVPTTFGWEIKNLIFNYTLLSKGLLYHWILHFMNKPYPKRNCLLRLLTLYKLRGMSTLAQVKQSTYLTKTINIIFTWRYVNIGTCQTKHISDRDYKHHIHLEACQLCTSQTKHLPDQDYKHHIHLEACQHWHLPNKAHIRQRL